MDWSVEANKFIQQIYEKGIKDGRDQEHIIKQRVCKYFRHQGGVMWFDNCAKTKGNCYREYCPAEKEEMKSMRS